MKVSKTTSVREEHGCNIYSIAFSQDILVEELNNRNKCYYRTFCSCAGPYVTVYKIQVFDLIDGDVFTGPSGPMLVHQSYVDVHPEEEFWACAFGGRSFLPTKPTKLPAFKKQQSNTCSKEGKPKKRKEQGSMVECEEEADTSMHEDFLSHSNDDDDEPLRINLDQQPTGPQLLCAAGKNRTIQVIDTTQQKLWMSLQGHGDEINCLKFHPIDNNILASASNDKSVRLWNLRNGTNIAILAGHEGHKDIVLAAGWHPTGEKLVTGGHDNLVKIWNMEEGTDIHKAMQDSYKIELTQNETATTKSSRQKAAKRQNLDLSQQLVQAKDYFKPVICQFPIHSTHKVHYQPVDCVDFIVSPMLLTKASTKIVLWYPNYVNEENPAVVHPAPADLVATFKTFEIADTPEEVFFYRFATCPAGKLVAAGNSQAEVFLFDVDAKSSNALAKLVAHPKIATHVRMTAFSPDGRILLCCCDDGTIAKWDIRTKN